MNYQCTNCGLKIEADFVKLVWNTVRHTSPPNPLSCNLCGADMIIVESDLVEKALEIIENRHTKAIKKYKPFNSAKEGWAVIKFELDELKELIQKNKASYDGKRKIPVQQEMIDEAAQVSAMALRFMIDLCGDALQASLQKGSKD